MTVYVLKLENDKYYIGKTEVYEDRVRKHFTGKESSWTKLHKPVAILEVFPYTEDNTEKKKTLEYMKKYGYQNVRGYAWTSKFEIKNPFENPKNNI